MMFRADIRPAAGSLIYTVIRTDISYAGAQFEVPSLAKNPLVAVTYTCSVIPAFVPCVAAIPEQVERGAYIPDIEFPSMDMETEEMSVELFAQPVSRFRLYKEMLPLPVVGKIPGIVVS